MYRHRNGKFGGSNEKSASVERSGWFMPQPLISGQVAFPTSNMLETRVGDYAPTENQIEQRNSRLKTGAGGTIPSFKAFCITRGARARSLREA